MLTQDMYQARQAELAVSARKIDQRIEWHQLSRIHRLESAVRAARVRFPWNNPGITAKAN
jgi:hypothetical protein